MKSIHQLAFVIFTFILSSFSLAQEVDAGYGYFQAGRFEEAVAFWETTLATLSPDHSPAAYLDKSIQLAAAYQSLGRLQRALEILQKAESIAAKLNDSISHANVLSQLADIYLAMRDLTSEDLRQVLGSSSNSASPTGVMEKAQQCLQLAVTIITKADINSEAHLLVLANILNKQGNFFVILKKYERALESYEESEKLAEKSGDTVLAVKSSLNRLQALIESGETDSIEKELTDKAILQRVKQLPDSHDKAFTLIRLASLVQFSSDEEKTRESQSPQKRRYAYETLQQALEIAEKQQDNLAIAYAKGDLAQLFAKENRYEEAIELTKQAISDSPSFAKTFSEKRPELLFCWEWQLGKSLKVQGKIEDARDAYERAKEQLQTNREVYRCGPEKVCKDVQTFYLELVDLLLQKATQSSIADERNSLLKEVIINLESKVSGLQMDLNPCSKLPLENLNYIEHQLPKGTVVLYPIALYDRIELLLMSEKGIQQFPATKVNRYHFIKEVERQLDNFRVIRPSVTDWHEKNRDGLLSADKLYQWLIKPMVETLEEQKIDTIVIVPNDKSTLLPFATLYDGEKYLVEKYALAIIPGLRLTDFTWPRRFYPTRALLIGVSKFDESPLQKPFVPHINKELKEIAKTLRKQGEVDILLDEQSTLATIEAKLRENAPPYSVVHFSTYTPFSNRSISNSEETFLQTYDASLSVDQLGELIKYRRSVDQPLDLLTLSTSHTALRGERSSLELMGIALKTEARSVLASLWDVNDEATAKLMTGFYQHWQQNDFSNKAKALQQAQLELLRTPGFEHPYYWASFVLIGNWQ